MLNDVASTTGQQVRQRVVFSHFVTLLVAGHETTANTMGFMMYHLSQNPEWEERLRQEIRVRDWADQAVKHCMFTLTCNPP